MCLFVGSFMCWLTCLFVGLIVRLIGCLLAICGDLSCACLCLKCSFVRVLVCLRVCLVVFVWPFDGVLPCSLDNCLCLHDR